MDNDHYRQLIAKAKTLLLNNHLFLVAAILFLLHQIAERLNYHIRFIDSYLDDVLLLPVITPIILLLWFAVNPKKAQAKLNLFQFIFLWMICSLWFEILAPHLNSKFTSDPWDVLAYAIGGLLVVVYGRCVKVGKIQNR